MYTASAAAPTGNPPGITNFSASSIMPLFRGSMEASSITPNRFRACKDHLGVTRSRPLRRRTDHTCASLAPTSDASRPVAWLSLGSRFPLPPNSSRQSFRDIRQASSGARWLPRECRRATASRTPAYSPPPPPPYAHTYPPPPGSSPHYPAARKSDCPACNTSARRRWPAPASPRRCARRNRPPRRGPARITPDLPESPRPDPPSAAARADSAFHISLHRSQLLRCDALLPEPLQHIQRHIDSLRGCLRLGECGDDDASLEARLLHLTVRAIRQPGVHAQLRASGPGVNSARGRSAGKTSACRPEPRAASWWSSMVLPASAGHKTDVTNYGGAESCRLTENSRSSDRRGAVVHSEVQEIWPWRA